MCLFVEPLKKERGPHSEMENWKEQTLGKGRNKIRDKANGPYPGGESAVKWKKKWRTIS